MKTLKIIILGIVLGLSINTSYAGGFGVSIAQGSFTNTNIALEYEYDFDNKIFLFNSLNLSNPESFYHDKSCSPTLGFTNCDNTHNVERKDIDIRTGVGYNIGEIFKITGYVGLGFSKKKTRSHLFSYRHDPITLQDEDGEDYIVQQLSGSTSNGYITKTKQLKAITGLKIEKNILGNLNGFIDWSFHKYNSDVAEDRMMLGIKYNF